MKFWRHCPIAAVALLLLFGPITHAEVVWSPPDGVPVMHAQDVGEWTLSAANGQNETLIIWHDNRSADVGIYGQLLDNQGAPQWPDNGLLLAQREGLQRPVALLPMGNDDWYLLFDSGGHEATKYTHFDLYAQRITPEGDLLWNAGELPALVGVFVGSTAIHLPFAQAAAGPENSVYVSWQSGEDAPLRMIRHLANGELDPTWPAEGLELGSVANWYSRHFQLTSDDAGDALVVWTTDNQSTDRRAHKVSPQGELLWGETGVDVDTSPESSSTCSIAPDQFGGAFVAWAAYTGDGSHIYMQHLDNNGDRLWLNEGHLLSSLDASRPRLVSLNPGSVAVVFNAQFEKLLAQKISGIDEISRHWSEPDGTLDEGIDLTGDVFNYSQPHVLSDRNGGVLVSWASYSEESRIQHINADGEELLVDGGLPLHDQPIISSTVHNALTWDDQLIVAEALSREGHSRTITAHRFDVETSTLLTPAGGLNLTDGITGYADFVQAVVSGQTPFALWQDNRHIGRRTTVLQALNPETGERLFGENGMVLFEGVYNQDDLVEHSLAPDGAGGVIAHSAYEEDNTLTSVLQRVNASGELLWGDDGVHYQPNQGWFGAAEFMLPSGDGGAAIVGFILGDNWTLAGYMQRFDADGVPQWGTGNQNFLPLFTGDYFFNELLGAVQIGNGNYAVIWSTTDEVLLQFVSPEGELTTEEPIVVGSTPSLVRFHQLLPLQDDVVVAQSYHANVGHYALRVMRVATDGTVVWDEESILEDTEYGEAEHPNLATHEPTSDTFWISWQNENEFPQELKVQQFAVADAQPQNDAYVIATTDSFYPSGQQLVMMENDDALLAWSTFDEVQGADLFYRRIRPDGTFPFGYQQPQYLCAAPDRQNLDVLINDGTGGAYAFWRDERGGGELFGADNVYGQRIHDNIDSVADRDDAARIDDWKLHAAYPNPFNGTAMVSLTLPQTGELHLALYDVLGREVMTLRNGRIAAGNHRIALDASTLASGMYFLRARVDGHGQKIQKLMLLR